MLADWEHSQTAPGAQLSALTTGSHARMGVQALMIMSPDLCQTSYVLH